jgi:DNA-binding transcriptional LysR family regulator
MSSSKQHLLLRNLPYFLAVADRGNVTSAAIGLKMSQHSLSRRLKIMEDSLGVNLLTRWCKGVELTSEGIELHIVTRQAIGQLDRAVVRPRACTEEADL